MQAITLVSLRFLSLPLGLEPLCALLICSLSSKMVSFLLLFKLLVFAFYLSLVLTFAIFMLLPSVSFGAFKPLLALPLSSSCSPFSF